MEALGHMIKERTEFAIFSVKAGELDSRNIWFF